VFTDPLRDPDPGKETMNQFTHTTFDTGLGPVCVAASDTGIIRSDLPGEDPDAVIREVIARTGLEPVEGGERVDRAADQISAYLAGELREFDLELDWRLIGGGFHRDVLRVVAEIPYGETRSYGEVAELAGRLRAARAAGTALARNPIGLVIPCHRVVRSDGSTGGYGGGLSGTRLKQSLLDLEQSTGTLPTAGTPRVANR